MARVRQPSKPAKGVSNPPVIALANFAKDESGALTPMSFRVPEEFHREFKIYAAQHGMSMVDLLQESFRWLRDKRGR
jgi:hypothetical protein